MGERRGGRKAGGADPSVIRATDHCFVFSSGTWLTVFGDIPDTWSLPLRVRLVEGGSAATDRNEPHAVAVVGRFGIEVGDEVRPEVHVRHAVLAAVAQPDGLVVPGAAEVPAVARVPHVPALFDDAGRLARGWLVLGQPRRHRPRAGPVAA